MSPTPMAPGLQRGLVSIGLPVYNGMPHLREAVDTLLAQTDPDVEIIIADNASTDGTTEYCLSVAEQDARVRFHRNESNIGAIRNYELTMNMARGEYFAWAAHDDRYDPLYVARCREQLDRSPDAVMCVPYHRIIDERGRELRIEKEPLAMASPDLSDRLRAHLWRRRWITVYGLGRTEAIRRAWPEGALWGWDVVIVWNLLLAGPIIPLAQPLADYRSTTLKHSDSVLGGLTGSTVRPRWPTIDMRDAMLSSLGRCDVDAAARRTARSVLRRWLLTSHFRATIFVDLYDKARRQYARGAKARAAAYVLPMFVVSPPASFRGAYRALAARRQRDAR